MKKLLLTSCLALGLASGLSAAVINPLAGIGASANGNIKLNFDDMAVFTGGTQMSQANNGDWVQVKFVGDAQVVQAGPTTEYAPPFVSGLNGLGFGNLAGDHKDQSLYLSTGVGSIEFSFGSDLNYFGLLWGSVDDYNELEFYDNGVSIGKITGADVTANPNGFQGLNGTRYVNINTTLVFDTVIARSIQQYAFEIDNVAYRLNVPDSGATLALLGLSFGCLFFFRRKIA